MKHKLIAPALIVLAATAIAACGSGTAPSGGASAAATIPAGTTLNVGDVGNTLRPIFTFKSSAPTGYKLSWSNFDDGSALIQALQGGSLDIGVTADTGLISAVANGGLDLKAVAEGAMPATLLKLIAQKGSGITTIADLRGKSVAVTEGSGAYAFLARALAKAGLSLSDVKLVNLTPPEATAAFDSGKVDAWASWEPYSSQAIVTRGARILTTGEGLWNLQYFMVATPQTLANPAKAAAIAAWITQYTRSASTLSGNLAAWTEVYEKAQGLTPQVAKLAAPEQVLQFAPITAATIKHFAADEKFFLQIGAVTKTFDANTVLDPVFNSAVKKGLSG